MSKFKEIMNQAGRAKPIPEPTPKPTPEPTPEPTLETKRGRPRSKRSDPDFTQVSAYIRKSTHREVKMKLLELESEQDFSDLVEQLLQNWLSESN